MYKVYIRQVAEDKQIMICDSRIDDLAIINPVVTLEANKAGSFVFTLSAKHPFVDKIEKRKTVISVYRDNEEEPLFRGVCTKTQKDFYKQTTFTCEGELSYLNDSVQRPARFQGLNVVTLLTEYINRHNAQVDSFKQFEIGNVTVTDPNNYIYCYTNMNSTMQEIKEDLVDDLGGYLRVRNADGHRYIDYLAECPRECSQSIELGKNLTDYKSNLDTMDVASRIVPLGALVEERTVEGLDTRLTIESVNRGKDYLQSASLVEAYGTITKCVTWDNVTDANVLKSKASTWLSDQQFEQVTIECSAIDLSYAIKSISSFKLLDKVHIVSEAHGMDRWFPLTKIKHNLNSPEKDVFTFGATVRQGLTAKTAQVNMALAKASKTTVTSDFMRQAIEQATALISGGLGGHVVIKQNANGQPEEILIMDTDNINTARKVWRWNQGGFGYSRNGYGGPYGTAITMDGSIVADYITAGTIRGIKFNQIGDKFYVTEGGFCHMEDFDIQTTPVTMAYSDSVTYSGITITVDYYVKGCFCTAVMKISSTKAYSNLSLSWASRQTSVQYTDSSGVVRTVKITPVNAINTIARAIQNNVIDPDKKIVVSIAPNGTNEVSYFASGTANGQGASIEVGRTYVATFNYFLWKE